ncbi:MAG TPA: CHASE2 domain-containing protein, partial [Deltaproteobacteria bacterium]|nr:CHASE2 domain-containing protein [Deltaproteobacteria bacterium]
MNFGLKNKRFFKFIFILSLGALGFVCIIITAFGSVWTEWDYKVLDRFYRLAAASGRGPSSSSEIVYLLITDDSYRYFKKNILDRKDLAGINRALSALDPEAVAYDIIFARESSPDADLEFTHSIGQLGSAFLPVGLEYSSSKKPFKWESGSAYQRFKNEYLKNPEERGASRPYYAIRALMQADDFSTVAYNSGHISAFSDPDGVYRHAILLLKVEERFFPALALSLFLDYAGVSLDEIIVEWGRRIVIPAKKGNNLENDVIIPIDDRGRAFIPFTAAWETDFKKMEAHLLVKHFENIDLRGNLIEFFEGKHVFVGDVSVGISDLGQTPLEADVPLIAIHTALFNGMLTNTFYSEWHLRPVLGVIVFVGVFLGSAALPKSSWFLYIGGLVGFLGIFGLTWWQMLHFRLLPVVTVGGSAIFILFILIAGLQIAVSRDRAFIKNAFSRYISEKVVDELMAKPEL